MSDKKFTVRSGARVRLELPAGETADTAEGDGGRRRSLTAADDDPTRYAFRGEARINLYDLGKALAQYPAELSDEFVLTGDPRYVEDPDNPMPLAYLELALGRVIAHANDPFTSPGLREALPDPDDLAAAMAALVNSHLASEAHVAKVRLSLSGREVPLAAPVPFACNRRFIQFEVNEEAYVLGDPEGPEMFVEPSPAWKQRKEGDEEGAEVWRAFSVESGEAHGAGFVKPKGAISRLAVSPIQALIGAREDLRDVQGVYEFFDTADRDNFRVERVTSGGEVTPDAELRLPASKPVNVFLVPRLQYVHLRELHFAAAVPDYYYYAGRVPTTVNLFDPETPPAEAQSHLSGYVVKVSSNSANPVTGKAIAGQVAGGEVQTLKAFSFDESLYMTYPATFKGFLVAIIEQGGTRFRVYRTTDRAASASDYNPYLRTLDGVIS